MSIKKTAYQQSNKGHITSRINRIFAHDSIRKYKILEMIQYTVLYCVFGFVFALISNRISKYLFKPFVAPKADASEQPTPCDRSLIPRIIGEITFQICFISISIFYIIKIVKVIPFLFHPGKNYIPYRTKEYAGGIALSFMFLKMQPFLSEKLSFLSKCLMK